VLATSVGGIFHLWVDKIYPGSTGSPTDYTQEANNMMISQIDTVGSFFNGDYDTIALVRGYIAAIVVSYPLFLVLAIILKKQLIKQPMVKNLRSRKILIYITLIGTFVLMLGEIITTGYDFLAGSFTDNALRHLLVTFIIAGAIFIYFFSEVKNDGNVT